MKRGSRFADWIAERICVCCRTFVNQHSRQLVERMRMRRIVELYDLLDWQGERYS